MTEIGLFNKGYCIYMSKTSTLVVKTYIQTHFSGSQIQPVVQGLILKETQALQLWKSHFFWLDKAGGVIANH